METKYKVSIILAVIALFGGGGSFLVIDQSTTISTDDDTTIINEGDTVFESISDETIDALIETGWDIVCEEDPTLSICDDEEESDETP